MEKYKIRSLLYAENFFVTFAVGIFLTLPLWFQSFGRNELFFGQVFAVGAVGALVCVLSSHWLLKRFGLSRFAPAGSLLFFIGSIIFLLESRSVMPSEPLLYLASLLHGMGWGIFLTQGPLCMSSTLEDKERSYYFTIYGAYNTMGIGLAPIFCSLALKYLGMNYSNLYTLACVTSFVAFLLSSKAANRNKLYATVGQNEAGASSQGIGTIMRLPSAFFLTMVVICACVYTSMMNFQATFATSIGIDYTIFFSFYTLAVVSARFGLSKSIAKFSPGFVIAALALLMVIALTLLLYADLSVVVYAMGALLLGVSYGLLYPLIQAQAVNHAPSAMRAQALIAFSLSYLVARYLFPYLGAVAVQEHGYRGLFFLLLIGTLANLGIATYFYTIGPGKAPSVNFAADR
ncbi:MFS transporter [Undibacterium sp. SXout7W]|uniref:MFS transporter n=1 Tax=Undibacterium sp. SXout7W TaxID=3413049 RepID=UPI003BF2E760